MKKILFDSHAHLNNENFTEERVQALASAIDLSPVKYMMDIGFDLESSEKAVKHSEKYDFCYAAVGFHPHDAKSMDDAAFKRIRELTTADKVMAVGEIGLDYHYDHSPRPIQQIVFRAQLQMAKELKMPICIHSREADQETMDILKEEGIFDEARKKDFPKRPNGSADARLLMHCYSGSAELAKEYIKLGATISIAGPVTYKNNKKTVRVVEEIPIDYLLIETDSPYLSPEPFRGKPNTSPRVEYVARKIAEIKDMDYEKVARITCENAMRFYGIK